MRHKPSGPIIVAEQDGSHYLLHVFEDDLHRIAWQRVNNRTLVKPADVHGSKRPYTADHRGEFNPVVNEMRELLASQQAPAVAEMLPPMKTYAVGDVRKTVNMGQVIGILHINCVVNAVVEEITDDHVTVAVQNGPYKLGAKRRIDCTRTGPGLTLDKIVSPTEL